MQPSAIRIHISGIVQGVGFRPFVYGLASKYRLLGWVRNSSAGVEIEVEGNKSELLNFIEALGNKAPALAKIDLIESAWIDPQGFQEFLIKDSKNDPSEFQPVSADVCICDDCLKELFDPDNRRFRYPFINCTNCGPRFTIVQDIPYDRPNTTMAGFPLCPDCAAEYHDPLDRRFHAQPVACSTCGPRVWLESSANGEVVDHGDDAIRAARRWLLDGKILAIKGLGGFHLACDATNPAAVAELRSRKLRIDKAFALMMADVNMVREHCLLRGEEEAVLTRRERPIVILERRPESAIAVQAAPSQDTLGVMLPYTPLHYLLFAEPGQHPVKYDMPPLVMTSANLSDEPICTDNAEARERLVSLADGFLMHNRPIHMRCDDSVVRLFHPTNIDRNQNQADGIYPIRRGRGYSPAPVVLNQNLPPILAVGAELKNTFCLTRDRYAFVSHHIGDLENYETLLSFEQSVSHYERLFRIKPEKIACDLHPDYLSTRYAEERACSDDLPLVSIQHHHAHIAACMAENGLPGDEPVLGVSFDGTGFGDDGAIWGGEILLSDFQGYQRLAHLAYVPLPGGDLAVKEPWRMALAWLEHANIAWEKDLPPVKYAISNQQSRFPTLDILRHQLASGINAAPTSSVGRLFDAVAALCGIRSIVNYEAQAAIELEAISEENTSGWYSFELQNGIIEAAPVIRAIVDDMRCGQSTHVIGQRFHNSVAKMVQQVCEAFSVETGTRKVVLSGGVWQNIRLLSLTYNLLRRDNYEVTIHHQIPANDGGLSLGQAVIAAAQIKSQN